MSNKITIRLQKPTEERITQGWWTNCPLSRFHYNGFLLLSAGYQVDKLSTTEQTQPTTNASNILPFELSDIPRYSGSPFCEVNNNKPYFQSDELTTDSFRRFSELDSLGRCGVAFACIGTDSFR